MDQYFYFSQSIFFTQVPEWEYFYHLSKFQLPFLLLSAPRLRCDIFATSRASPTCMLVPQRGQLLQFSLSQSVLKDSSTAFWITFFPKRCSMNFFPSTVADRYSSLRPRSSSGATKTWFQPQWRANGREGEREEMQTLPARNLHLERPW